MFDNYFETDLYRVYAKANALQIPVRFIGFQDGVVFSIVDYLSQKDISQISNWIVECERNFPLLKADDIYFFLWLAYLQSLQNIMILSIPMSQSALLTLLQTKKKVSEVLFLSQYQSWVEEFIQTVSKENSIFAEKNVILSTLSAMRQNPRVAISDFKRTSYRALYSGIFNRHSSELKRAKQADFDDNSKQGDSIKELLLQYPGSERINVNNGIDIFADAICTNVVPMIRYIDNTGEIKTKVYFSDDQYQKVLYSLVTSKIETDARNVIYFTIFSLKDLDWNKADKDSFQVGTIYLENNVVEILSRSEGKIQKKSKKEYISTQEILLRILQSFPSVHLRTSVMGKISGQFSMMIDHRTNLVVYTCTQCNNESIVQYEQCPVCKNYTFAKLPLIEFTGLGVGIEMNSFLTFILTANVIGKYFLYAEESSASTTEKLRKTLNYRKLLGREYENLATGSNELYENKASSNVSFNILNELGQNVLNKNLILSGQAFTINDNNTLITIDITNAMSESSLSEFYRFFPYIVQVWYMEYLKLQYESFRMMPETIEYLKLKREYVRMITANAPPVHQASIKTKTIELSLDELPDDANDVLRHVQFDNYGNIIEMPVYVSSNKITLGFMESANEVSSVNRVEPYDGYAYNIPHRQNYIEFPLNSGQYHLVDELHHLAIAVGQVNEPHVVKKSMYSKKRVSQLRNADDSIEKYLNIYRGGINDTVDTLKMATNTTGVKKPGELAVLPIGISALLSSYSKSLYRMRYISTSSPNSFIDCICGAIADPYYAGTKEVSIPESCPEIFWSLDGQKINTSIKRILYTKLLRYRMATELNLEVLRQEFPNINLEVIQKKLLNFDEYFPANIYYRLAEEFFNINIYLFSFVPILAVPTISKVKEAKSTVDDGLMCISDHTSIAVRTYRPYRNTIGILLNNKNATRQIQCELIVESISGLSMSIRTLFDNRFNDLCYLKYIALVSSISWNYTTSSEIYSYDYRLTSKSILRMFNDFEPVSQYIDETGKMKRINFAYRDDVCPINIFEQKVSLPVLMFTICLPGFQPENLPFNSDVYLVDSSFITALMVDSPIGRTADERNLTTGLWYSSDTAKFAFYFPVIATDKYLSLPIGPEQYYARNDNSNISTLVTLQRKANIFSNILKYLFNLYRRNIVADYIEGEKVDIMLDTTFKKRGDKAVPRDNRKAILRVNKGERAGLQITEESVVRDFIQKYFLVLESDLNSNNYYDFSQIPRKFPDVKSVDEAIAFYENYAPNAFRKDKIIILNQKLSEQFVNLLYDFYYQNADDTELPVFLNKYYFSESDYVSSRNNIVFLNEFLYGRWFKSVTAGIQYAKRIHTTIQYYSTFDTYIYAMQLPNKIEKHYIIQRVDNDNDYTALTVALIWQQTRINVGHNIPKQYITLTSYSAELPNFLIWGIDTNMHIVPHIDGRSNREEKCVEILYFGKFAEGSEKRYAAMLPLD